jgi:hypothetical protein
MDLSASRWNGAVFCNMIRLFWRADALSYSQDYFTMVKNIAHDRMAPVVTISATTAVIHRPNSPQYLETCRLSY